MFEKATTWKHRSESERSLKSMVNLAAIDKRIQVSAAKLDADKMLLGTENGVLDLTTGKLRDAIRP